jgi:hypothetical protein
MLVDRIDLRSQLLDVGYVVAEDLIDDAALEGVREELHQVVDGIVRGMHGEGLIPETWSEQGFDRQLACVAEHDMAMAVEAVALHTVPPSTFPQKMAPPPVALPLIHPAVADQPNRFVPDRMGLALMVPITKFVASVAWVMLVRVTRNDSLVS